MTEEKAALRTALFARRKAVHGDAARDAAANARLLAMIGEAEGRIVSGFRPIRTEIDPTEAMTTLHEAGARLCVPVIEAKGAPLRFREWAPGAAMERGEFGAEVPASGAWLEPEILVVPLLGWDRAGRRLGYGGGFYDRTLARLRAKGPAQAIGFAYAAQEVSAVPAGPEDERLDAIATETESLEIAR
ncbi:MAG: 5-formyltetrahydrofolate cyclo-ligase [Pikeienuella sp.]|uniref:5-formyltetrahydrofolate cyclo-ligase n=1 Tax=Pikeienuella sp. TaxID=2831957 RepID=UPI00391C6B5A